MFTVDNIIPLWRFMIPNTRHLHRQDGESYIKHDDQLKYDENWTQDDK